MGLEIVEFPQIIKAKREFKKYSVDGIQGEIIEDLGNYSSYTLNVDMSINPFHKNYRKNAIRDIANFLDGSGELILSIDKERKYKAIVNNNIPISNFIDVFPNFRVNFLVQPFRQKVNEYEIEIFSKTHFLNEGDIDCNPVITIFGNGNINLIINGKVFKFINVVEKITVNSEIFSVYKDKINEIKKFKSFDFPIFKKGNNTIEFVGNVEKIVVEPKTLYF